MPVHRIHPVGREAMEALGGCTTFLGEMGDEMAERGQLSAIGDAPG